MKKAIIALIVLILAAGGSVGAFLAVKNGKEKEKQQASKVLAENELFSFDPYSPTKIVFSKGDEVYEVVKQNDKWTLTSGEFAMDQDYCQLICTYFSDLTAETNYGEITDEKLEMYGLTDPDTIEVTEPGGTHILKVGDPSPMGDYYYVTADGRDKVYAISYMEGSVLKLDRLLLKNKELLTYSLYDIKEVIVKKDGKTTLDLSFDPDTQEWSLPDEYSSLKVDPTMITTVLNNLVRLESEEMLDESRLVAIVSDSDYVKDFPPGTVLSQVPKSGSEVKSGRIVYLTINRRGKAPVRMPDLIRNVTVRIAENQLTQLGFHLAPNQYVEGEPEDLVIGIKQGIHNVYGGDMVSVDRALTLVVGAGIPLDTLEVDTFGIVDDGGFDIEL